jgi:hypothetical protein
MGGRPHPRRGLFLIVGYLSSVAAMRHGDIGLVAPFRYTSLSGPSSWASSSSATFPISGP